MQDEYVIWRTAPVPGWLSPDGWTQSAGMADAGRFDRERALTLCRGNLPRSIYAGRIIDVPIRLIDMQALLGPEAFSPGNEAVVISMGGKS